VTEWLWLGAGVVIGVCATLAVRQRPGSPQSDRVALSPAPEPLHDEARTQDPVAESTPGAASDGASGQTSTATEEPVERLGTALQALLPRLDAALQASVKPSDMLADDAFEQAVARLAADGVALDLVFQYGQATNVALSCAALEAIAGRTDAAQVRSRVVGLFEALGVWQLFFALRAVLAADPTAPIGSPFTRIPEWWLSRPLAVSTVRDHLHAAHALGGEPSFGTALERSSSEDVARLVRLLELIDDALARELVAEVAAWQKRSLNRAALLEFGRFTDVGGGDEPLCELPALAEPLAVARAALLGEPASSVIVVGEPRSGKTSVVRLIAARLTDAGIAVFEAGALDLMAGRMYVGQLEERIRLLLRELSIDKRVVWHVPDLLQLATAGRHQGQSASILDLVLPAIAAGNVVLVSEATPAQLAALLQYRPSLRSILQLVRLPALSAAEVEQATTTFAATLAHSIDIEISEEVALSALHLARQHLGAQHAIGVVFDYLKLASARALASGQSSLSRDGLLATLAQATGLPRAVLDDGERLELAAVRTFFSERVIGQPAAVATIVDRIAMLKSGLIDPGRPIGVFLFAGPTGTGKTELARTLAEYLFGGPDRMIRLDMSEFQTAESTHRILGDRGESGEAESLAQRVRKQPFCVILLDEFEKAHPNAWDLFLQVFDDGRLTDANGLTVDFRHAFVILTTNLGATAHKGNLGFTPDASSFVDDQVLRAVHASFRPEFVNRLDRVIVFQPLGREIMRDILKKELRRVLERRGLRERDWAVEWESSALDFLLEKGFSPDMGARPLRRAIDEHLLAPLAATLVEHRYPAGEQFLFVRSDGRAIQVEFVDPDAELTGTANLAAARTELAPEVSLAGIILQPSGSDTERALLHARLAAARARLDTGPLEATRASLERSIRATDFWVHPDRFVVLARYALHDRLRVALRTAEALETRLARSVRAGSHSRALAGRLALHLHLVELGLDDAERGRVTDVILTVTPALDVAANRDGSHPWCTRLLGMYRSWAAARHMQLAEHQLPSGSALVIGGFGAWDTLHTEAGLHVLEPDGGGRVSARVRIAAEDPGHATDVTERDRSAALEGLLAAASVSNEVVRRYRDGTSPLVRDARAGWRTGRLDLVLEGGFDLIGAAKIS
jgi:ATP-dependent Clp protease ATP-binding subunit ClpC